jgi:hypothetical protein
MPKPSQPAPSISRVGSEFLHHPLRILLLWNWKSAVLSIILRAPIFLIASVRRGWMVAASALFTEALFCAVSAGFYGTIVQALRNAEPEWLAGLFITVLVPAGFQVIEYWLHWLRGTPHLRIAEIVSVSLSLLSALFNWFAMKRGALLVGGEGAHFGSDLKRIPRLLFDFVYTLPLRGLARAKVSLLKLAGNAAVQS